MGKGSKLNQPTLCLWKDENGEKSNNNYKNPNKTKFVKKKKKKKTIFTPRLKFDKYHMISSIKAIFYQQEGKSGKVFLRKKERKK